MRKVKCSRESINKYPLETLGEHFSDVRVALFGFTDQFPSPPVTEDNMKLLFDDLGETAAKFKNGGKLKKPDYVAVVLAIRTMLHKIADYVDEVANGNKDIVELSELEATGQVHLGDKAIKENYEVSGVAGKKLIDTLLETTCDALGKDAIYTCVVSEDNPLPKDAEITANGQLKLPKNIPNIVHVESSNQKTKMFTDLTPRTHYYITYFAKISKVVTRMSDVVEVW